MKKIPSLFLRNYDGDRCVYNEVTPGTEWVIAGEGVATYKWDGTCCMVRDGKFYKRYELRKGKTPPPNFEPACEVDTITGKQQGWIPVDFDDPGSKYHVEAWNNFPKTALPIRDGTYELIGPKVQTNMHNGIDHQLVPHGGATVNIPGPITYHYLKAFFAAGFYGEGIVWHHPDGRMVKLKVKDFPK